MDSGSASPRLLVVDDDPDVLASLERGLRLSGFEVSTAVDGAEALRSATEFRPDAIILDINMPVLDGVSVVTALRAMDNDVPVCVLSARSSVDDRVAGLEAGADDYLVKPFVLAELVARVEQGGAPLLDDGAGLVLVRAAPVRRFLMVALPIGATRVDPYDFGVEWVRQLPEVTLWSASSLRQLFVPRLVEALRYQ